MACMPPLPDSPTATGLLDLGSVLDWDSCEGTVADNKSEFSPRVLVRAWQPAVLVG